MAEVVATPLRAMRVGGSQEPDFKIFSGPLQVLNKEADADGTKKIRCIASSSMKDLHGDTMTEHCIRSMAKQAAGLTIFLNHEYAIPEDVFGYVEKARTKRMNTTEAKAAGVSDEMIFKAASSGSDVLLLELTIVLDSGSDRAERSYNQMESGITLGVSIGALITDYEIDEEADTGGWFPPLIINDVDLLEASIVGIPANPLSWVEGATKGVVMKGVFDGVDKERFDDMRRTLLKRVPPELFQTSAEEEPTVDDDAVVKAETPEEPQKFNADGADDIIAHFQIEVEEKRMSAIDLDAMEDAVQEAIDFALANGVDEAEFEGQSAKDIASLILSTEPAEESEPEAEGGTAAPEDAAKEASAEADESTSQEAPDVSDPESADEGGDEAAKQAEAELNALSEAGVLKTLNEAVSTLAQTLESLFVERSAREGLEEKVAELTAKLEDAEKNVSLAVQLVNQAMDLPMQRKSQLRRESATLAERLKGGPYTEEFLRFVQNAQGASK